MSMLAATLAVAAPLILADEKSFLHLPDGYEFRFQHVSRTDHETGWPFSVDKGLIACVWGLGQRLTYFYEDVGSGSDAEVQETPRFIVLSVNPLDVMFGSIGGSSLIAKHPTLEERIKLVGPFVAMAQRLCDQPQGTHVGPGEL
ncbi:MAG TPA: hypothetical protein VMF90_07465 [Rhizobiaceae bacterium]|nr:hypothetical protein [Rhizobiaceae bacterium]